MSFASLLLVSGLGAHPAQTAGAVKAAAAELVPEPAPPAAEEGHSVRNTFVAILGVAAAAGTVAAVRKKGP